MPWQTKQAALESVLAERKSTQRVVLNKELQVIGEMNALVRTVAVGSLWQLTRATGDSSCVVRHSVLRF